MQFDKDVVDFHFHNILNGCSPFVVGAKLFLAKHITSEDVFYANAFTFRCRKKFQHDGYCTEYELLKDAESKGLWGQSKENDLRQLKTQIERKLMVVNRLPLPSQQKAVRAEISSFEKKIQQIELEKAKLTENSIESCLAKERWDFIISRCVLMENRQPLWSSYDKYLDGEVEEIELITSAYVGAVSEIKTPLIRAIAKLSDARQRFSHAQKQPINSLSVQYLDLAEWCNFYSQIYQMGEEKPDESIILDDEKLDGWLASRRAEAKLDKSVNTGEGFVARVGATKEDMGILGGVQRDDLLRLAQHG